MQIIKVYGPYERKEDNRKIVVLHLIDGTLTTKTYARYLYEKEHGEIGNIDLTVDHVDEDVTNDVLSNFELLTRADNISKSARPLQMYEGICPQCNKEFNRALGQVKRTLAKGLKPCCSKNCSGRLNAYK
jgi:hypothetical protein